MANLTGKTALVTGGSRGIGAGIARRLAEAGADVAITYTKGEDAAASVVREVEAAGRRGTAIRADAADAQAVADAVEKTVSTHGRLDVLVNNAGVVNPGPFEQMPLEDLDRLFAINVRGVMLTTQAALKHMGEGGRIVTIGSCVGERVSTPGVVAYATTKGAVKMFTQALARELGPRGITVNTVQPGPIATDLNPADGDFAPTLTALTTLKRYGSTADVASLVAFLAGPESGYITGTSLTIDGGMNA